MCRFSRQIDCCTSNNHYKCNENRNNKYNDEKKTYFALKPSEKIMNINEHKNTACTRSVQMAPNETHNMHTGEVLNVL